MINFCKLIIAALIDFKWFIGAFVLFGALTFGCSYVKASPLNGTTEGKITEPKDAAHNHSPYGSMVKDGAEIILQIGSFNCKAGEHRAVFVIVDGTTTLGCANVSKDGIVIQWETGQTTTYRMHLPDHDSPPPKDMM